MSKQDEQRATVLGQVGAGILGVVEAAALIGVSERQVRRLLVAYQREGPRGIVHGNRGRPPAHATSAEVRTQVIALATGKYEGGKQQLALTFSLSTDNSRATVCGYGGI